MDNTDNIVLLTCLSNKSLSMSISEYLNIELTKCDVSTFSNTETRVIVSNSIRNKDVYLLQTGEGNNDRSVNDHLMDTLITIDACKRASAKSINVLLALYPYSRQDKKDNARAPISSSLVAHLISSAGATRVITVELHADQIQGMFQIPVDNISIENRIMSRLLQSVSFDNVVIVSPDSGGAKRAERIAKAISRPLALMYKKRDYSVKNKVDETVLLGDVKDATAVIIDDMADTCGTLLSASKTLIDNGAKKVYAMVTHGIFSGNAIENINNSEYLSCIYTSNSLDQRHKMKLCPKIKDYDIGYIISQAIRCINSGESLSDLLKNT